VQNGKKRGQYRLAEAQAGLAIQILTFMPLRIKNLTDLTFDEHIFLRPGGTSTLLIREEEAKSGKGVEFDIPPALAERLIEYRHSIAARIIGRPPDRLFTKVDGSPKGTRVVRYLIERYMKLYVGIHMNPHVFRHLAAKFILDANPSAHVVVQHLLGHTNVQTTATFYAGMDTRRAGRHHQALLEASLARAEEQAKASVKSSKRRRGRRV
ncbi:MAG: site-specific integrase, partial [Oricola sp.]